MNYLLASIFFIIFLDLVAQHEVVGSATTSQQQRGRKKDAIGNKRIDKQKEAANDVNKKQKIKKSAERAFKVAVIGSEISAALFKYYLTKMNEKVVIDIFSHERSNKTIPFVVHEKQKYMNDIIAKFGLSLGELYPNDTMPIVYDGRDNARIAPVQVQSIRFKNYIETSLQKFEHIYNALEDKSKYYPSLLKLIMEIDRVYAVRYLKIRAKELFGHFLPKEWTSQNFLKALLLLNYGQNLESHALVGILSSIFSDLTGKSFKITDSFGTVFQKLTTAGAGRILKGKVLKVTEGTYRHPVSWQEEENKPAKQDVYDHVVIATSDIGGIDFTSFQEHVQICKYRKSVLTTINGELKGNIFKPNNPVSSIVNTKDDKFRIANKIKGEWKIISENGLNQSDLDDLFRVEKFENSQENYLWPDYSDTDCISNLKFDIDRRLYFMNAIEWASNSLEMKAVAAKNMATMIYSREQLVNKNRKKYFYEKND